MTTTIASVIEDKKREMSGTNTQDIDYVGFLISILTLIVKLIISIFLGAWVLYTTKVAQALDNKNNGENKPIEINITSINNISYSVKVLFDLKTTFIDYIDELLTTYEKSNKISASSLFFLKLSKTIIDFNYLLVSKVLSLMGNWYETAVILLGPIVLFVLSFIIVFLNFVYSTFNAVKLCFTVFLKKNTNANNKVELLSNWVDMHFRQEMFAYVIGLMFAFLFLFLIFFVLLPLIGIASSIVFIITLLSYIYIVGTSTGVEGDRKYTFSSSLINTFLSKLKVIMILFSFSLVNNIFKYFGIISGIVISIVCIILYMKWITNDIYTNIIPINALVKVDISGGSGQLGGSKLKCDDDIIKQIKSVSKKMKKITKM